MARLVGGAGTGKTTELLKIMAAAIDRLGGDPLRLGFASFTRAARAEAVERASVAWGVTPDLLSRDGWFRTVHSTVYRCLECKSADLLAGRQSDLQWLSEAMGVRLSVSLDDDTGSQQYLGDPLTSKALDCWSLARCTLRPLEEIVKRMFTVDDSVPNFDFASRAAERYETAKRIDGKYDYTDMLMRFAGVAGSPRHGFTMKAPEGMVPELSAWLFDEQQDASPLLDIVCRRLVNAESVQWAYVVGDPMQAIYGFAGSTSKCFMSWEVDKERIMPKSWRCPRPIMELAEKCLARMRNGVYWDRQIAPADHAGEIGDASEIDEVVNAIDPKDDWLLIARTNFQARRIAGALSGAHKPFRWTTRSEYQSAKDIGLQAFFALENGKHITGDQWRAAVPLLPVKTAAGTEMLTRGTKAAWKDSEISKRWDFIWPRDLADVGATDALAAMIRSGAWSGLVDDGAAWREKAKRHGAELAAAPRVRVGTIHSVKGAEADNVAVLTTTSGKVARANEDDDMYNEECRVSYVAVTRARRRLIVIDEGGGNKAPRMEIL